MTQPTNEELLAIMRGMTLNMQISMKRLHDYDYKVGRNSICTGLGKYTTMALMGVCNGLEKRGMIVKVYKDESARRQGNHHWEVTPLGRAVADYAAATWDESPWL